MRLPWWTCIVLTLPSFAFGGESSSPWSVSGLLSAVAQREFLAFGENAGSSIPFQLEASYHAASKHEFFVKAGIAAGNGLDGRCPFPVPPWAADMEDAVKQLNGRDRDHLLCAWYKFTTQATSHSSLGLTLGLIDATDYVDDNAFANDEFHQFMNRALVNAPIAHLPSYDLGAAIDYDARSWYGRGVYMTVGENSNGRPFSYSGMQFGIRTQSSLGVGEYRFVAEMTSRSFLDASKTSTHRSGTLGGSLDQTLGDAVGIFLRLGLQESRADIQYGQFLSGGIQVSGLDLTALSDRIGLGYAYLNGRFESTHVGEIYYLANLTDRLALTLDLQYLVDELPEGRTNGTVLGFRATASL